MKHQAMLNASHDQQSLYAPTNQLPKSHIISHPSASWAEKRLKRSFRWGELPILGVMKHDMMWT
jgi:hypothetical protein